MSPKVSPVVQLVGSVPLQDTRNVFTKVLHELPDLVTRLPDGEIGERSIYVVWQNERFPPQIRSSPFMPSDSLRDANFDLRSDHIQPTGYDKAALASYGIFQDMRDQGLIPPGIRFQVGLPTPLNPIACFVAPEHAIAAEQFYEQRLLQALDNIQEGIPASDLAIQWDLASEPAHMEHAYGPKRDDFNILKPWYEPVREGIAARVARLAAAVKKDVAMGYHLCYGDFGHVHYLQPRDLGVLVDLANTIHGAVRNKRSVDWVHMPVPKDRVDEDFFSPLTELAFGDQTTLFLGVVHAHDKEGTEKRVDAASRALAGRQFGIATECGLGRTPVEDLDSIFCISREIAQGA